MNKVELIAAVAEKAGLSKKDAEKAVAAFVDSVVDAVAAGDKVQLVGFGTFEVRAREARTGRNPVSYTHLYKVFVNTISPIYDKEGKFLARRELRLIRRILRDDRFRASPVENTLDMWQQVVRGENLYMFPYVDTVDFLIDTTHAYEPCVFAGEVLPLLRSVASSHPQAAVAGRIAAALEQVAGIPTALVPPGSLLREFLGEGLY